MSFLTTLTTGKKVPEEWKKTSPWEVYHITQEQAEEFYKIACENYKDYEWKWTGGNGFSYHKGDLTFYIWDYNCFTIYIKNTEVAKLHPEPNKLYSKVLQRDAEYLLKELKEDNIID